MIEGLKQVKEQFSEVSGLFTNAQAMFKIQVNQSNLPDAVKKEINDIMQEINHSIANMDIGRAQKAQAKFEDLKKKYL